MAGPDEQTAIDLFVPGGESQRVFAPQALAWRIENMESTHEGTIRSVRGPAPIEPARVTEQGQPAAFPTIGRPYGLFFASLLGGVAPTTILRAGGTLYRQAGWLSRTGGALFGWEILVTGLNNEPRPRWPDQMLALHDKIIWTNGVDRARIISHDGLTIRLGFHEIPGAPQPVGPELPAEDERHLLYSNSQGYSWPGRIGTVGDVLDGGRTGTLLAGRWFYWRQWEDIHGNLSPLSQRSAPVKIHTQALRNPPENTGGLENSLTLAGIPGVEIDDLLRQFAVYSDGDGPAQAVAERLLRSMDANKHEAEPRLVDRHGGYRASLYPDKKSDSELGPVAPDILPFPVFRTMCAHQGCLIIANTPAEPGIVRRSQPGFSGTLERKDWCFPDAGGAEVIAVASHGGNLLAFTEAGVYNINNFANPVSLSQTVGCVAPRSIAALPSGMLIWLGRDGFYSMDPGGGIAPLSVPIERTVRHRINWGRVRLAVAAVDPWSGEYRCALAPGGRPYNSLLLTFDGSGWKEQDLGIDWADLCATSDWRRYLLGCGIQINTSQNNVWVLDHEVPDYTPPARTARFWSPWLRASPTGLATVNVRGIYVSFMDGSNNDATIEFFANGSWRPVGVQTNFRLVGTDESSRVVTDLAGVAVIGTSMVHERRARWRWAAAPDELQDVESWAFRISATYPSRMELVAFAFDVSRATSGSDVGRIAGADDTP